MNRNVKWLLEQWQRLAESIGMTGQFQTAMFQLLQKQYSEEGRHHHTLERIAMHLKALRSARRLADNEYALELAIWFQNYIYKPDSESNEQDSAEYAHDFLTASNLSGYADTVFDLIVATKHSDDWEAFAGDKGLFVDIDLVVLGQKPEVFDAYEEQIRREHQHLSDETFREERLGKLRKLLARNSIYITDFFYNRYEEQARENLERSVTALSA